jgi:hypothetical protein
MARRQREKAARLARSAEMWERGAEGEAATAAALEELTRRGWTTFHDVRWPGRQRANIDHVAVGPAGVFVIDSKNWSGDVRIVDDVLHQGGRRREREVAAAGEAALAVTQLLQGFSATPVLCFVRPEPVDGWSRGVLVCSTGNLAARLAAQPPLLGAESMRRVTSILQWQLASARRPVTTQSVPASWPPPHPPSRRPPVAGKTVFRWGRAGCGLLLGLVGLLFVVSLIGAILKGIDGATTHGGAGAVGTQRASAPTLGDVQRLPATSLHPALRVRAEKVVRVTMTPTGRALQQGRHLVGVRYTIRNDGTTLWGATPSYLRFSALMSDGQGAPAGNYSTLPTGDLMPAAFNLRAGKAQRGLVVFAVPDGVKLVRVSVKTGFGSSDAAEWLIP